MTFVYSLKELKGLADEIYDDVYDNDDLDEDIKGELLLGLDDICLMIENALGILS